MQTTIRSAAKFGGIGLHSGQPVRMAIQPAPAETGIWFRRADVAPRAAMVAARWDRVLPSRLCTVIGNDQGTTVSTVEHVMAALAGCGIHNAIVELDGPEAPILDGSSVELVQGILDRGLQRLDAPVRVIEVLEPVEVAEGGARARIEPSSSFEISFHIRFEDAAIGVQDLALNLGNGAFVRELCNSRTFCRSADVEAMRADGLARGGTLDNAIVVDGDAVLSPGGLRHADEAVRHKMLDALGDLALAGSPLLARYVGHRAGHALTNRLLRELFARPGAFRMIVCDDETARRLPGVGVTRSDVPVAADAA